MIHGGIVEAWHVVMTTDPLEDSEDERDENTRLDLCQCECISIVVYHLIVFFCLL